MAWEVEFNGKQHMVVVTAIGKVSGQDGRDQAEMAIRVLKENQATLVLVDYFEAESELSLANLYWLPDYFSELGASSLARIAVLLPRTGYRIESYQFFEVACKNAGYNVRLFAEKEPAENWLRQGQPATQAGRPLGCQI